MLWYFTDHRFVNHAGVIYDRFGFDARFFQGYLLPGAAQIRVVGRAEEVAALPTLGRTSFQGLEFVPLPNAKGVRWLWDGVIAGLRHGSAFPREDRAIIRIPSVTGLLVGVILALRGIPYLAEVVGEAREAAESDVRWAGAGVLAKLVDPVMGWVIRRARGVSYVSEALHRKFPARPGAEMGVLSSIRLPDDAVLAPRRYVAPLLPPPGIEIAVLSDIRLPDDAVLAPRQYEATLLHAPRMVCIASLYPRKGHVHLLAAFQQIAKQAPGATLLLIGDGPERERLEQLVRENGMAGVVTFRGHVSSPAEIFAALDGSDLFVLASLTEGLPRVVIEAMARGVPVVATDAGGTRELIAMDQVARIGDADDLAARVLALVSDPTALTRASAAGVERAKEYCLSRQSAVRTRIVRAVMEGNG